MKFALTHPLVTRPHHPDLVLGPIIARLARTAQGAGFNGYGFTDHPAPTRRWLETGGHDSLDPFAALGFVAASADRLRLIPNVIVLPYRNPFLIAKAGATLDLLSGGRFTLAVAPGYLRGEFRALGVNPDERGRRLEESIDLVRTIWTGEPVTFEGDFYSAREVISHPRPNTVPPIWIGGNGGAARRRVAERGDGWAPFPAAPNTADTAALDTLERFSAAVDDLHRRLEAAGRDPATVDISFTCTAGGEPGADDFHPEQHLEGLAALEARGVTWTQVPLPGTSPAHTEEVMLRYAETVIAEHRRSTATTEEAS